MVYLLITTISGKQNTTYFFHTTSSSIIISDLFTKIEQNKDKFSIETFNISRISLEQIFSDLANNEEHF